MNTIKTIFLIILMIVSAQVQSQSPRSASRLDFKRSLGGHHSHIGEYTWYLTINIKKLRQSEILKFLSQNNFNLSEQFILQLDKIPKELDKIVLYGNSLKYSGKVTAYLYGNLSDSMFKHNLEKVMYTKNGQSQLKEVKKKRIGRNEQLVFEHIKTHQKLYAKKINNGTYIVSNKVIYTKESVSKDSSENIQEDSTTTDLFVLNIDTEMARKSMQLNLENDEYIMQSKIFTKAKNILAIIQLKDENIIIGSALTTKNEETAIQIKKILDGVTAYSSLTDTKNEDSLQSILMNNMIIERKDKNVHIGTYIPLDRFRNNK